MGLEERLGMKALGRHLLLDLYECDPVLLAQVDQVRSILREAVRAARATIVTDHFHQFQPYGVSGVIVISESHATIHTWPEKSCAAVDLFTCSETVDTDRLVQVLTEQFKASQTRISIVERGVGIELDVKERSPWHPADHLR